MNDIKLAILRTFESTVKALLGSGQNDVQCVFDANADVGQVCDHLRNELSDVKARLQQLELKSGLHKISNDIINEWPEDIEEDSAFRRSFLSSIPIPLVVAPTVNAVIAVNTVPIAPIAPIAVIAENAVIAVPTTPELAPRAVETCEHVPDIIDTMHMDLDIVEIKSEVVIKEVVNVVEEEEEEGLEEIEYNGETYYKDSENLVYTLNDDGELNEKSVGRWNDVTNVVRFFAKSTVTK